MQEFLIEKLTWVAINAPLAWELIKWTPVIGAVALVAEGIITACGLSAHGQWEDQNNQHGR